MDWGQIGHVLGINFLLIMALMLASWIYYLFKKNAALLDLAWAGGFIIVSITSFAACHGYLLRRFVIFLLVCIWAVRLGGYSFRRALQCAEMGRCSLLHQKFGINSSLKLLALFIVQGIAIMVVSWPILLISSNLTPEFSKLELTSIIIWFIAIICESFADNELWKFKMDPQNKEKICKEGLWKYSRHPNYFFEWLVWVAFFLFALDAPLGLTAIISPICMWYFLVKFAADEAEAHSLETKGDQYREYIRTTSQFFPWYSSR